MPEDVKGKRLSRPMIRELLYYFIRLGTTGFGGPIALAGYMESDLVEARRWVTKDEFLEGLALAQLAPGPLAAQLAIYLGWVLYGVLGATLVGFAFVLPSFLIVVILSILYIHFGGLPWIQGFFYGIGASVIAIIVRSTFRLTRLTLGGDPLLWALFLLSGLITALTESEILWVFLLSGVFALLVRSWKGRAALAVTPLAFLTTGLKGPAGPEVLWRIALYFTKAGAFIFGSGLAIVPFLYSGVVRDFHWLTDRQFLDAVAVAMITPGPVVITVAFIGYLVAGFSGASLAALGVFLPCYLFVVIPAKYFHRYARNRSIKIFVEGLTSSVIGAIAGAAFVLGRRAIIDFPTSLIAVITLWLLLGTRKIPEPLLILGAGVAGFMVKGY